MPDPITRAASLNDQGKFRAAFEVVESFLRSDGRAPSDAANGVAWNVRGLALQSLGEHDDARRSYEKAIGILRDVPAQQGQYAAALDNLGSLKADTGQLGESRSLRLHARKLYAAVSDHAGVARISSNLSLVAMAQGNRKEARQNLAEAFREESLLPAPRIGDLAGMYSARCLLEQRDGNLPAALRSINGAIDLWTQHYGPEYYLLAVGYSVRGRVYDGRGDYQNALNDLEGSLALLRKIGEGDSHVFLLIQISYAQTLRHFGRKREAAQMESEAKTALQSERRRSQCGACTVSAESLR